MFSGTLAHGNSKNETLSHGNSKNETLSHGNSKNEKNKKKEGKKIEVSVEKSKGGTKKRSLDSLSLPNQNTIIIINIIW